MMRRSWWKQSITKHQLIIYKELLVSLPNILPIWDIHIVNIGDPKVKVYAIDGAVAFQNSKYFHNVII
jgi:hypothetical protein